MGASSAGLNAEESICVTTPENSNTCLVDLDLTPAGICFKLSLPENLLWPVWSWLNQKL